MNSFTKFLEQKVFMEADPPAMPPAGGGAPAGLGGLGAPAALPPMGGGAPPPLPPMGGPSPSLGGGPFGGPAPGAAPTGQQPKLKAYNIWDVLDKLLNGKNQEQG
jgi:hypothetical protein